MTLTQLRKEREGWPQRALLLGVLDTPKGPVALKGDVGEGLTGENVD